MCKKFGRHRSIVELRKGSTMNKSATLVLLAGVLLASTPDALRSQAQQTATASATRTETQLLKTIVFITLEVKWPDKDGKPGERGTLSGTGFWVAVPDSRLEAGKAFSYLVTNRHVAMALERDEKGNCKPLQILKASLTVNLKDPVNGNRSHTETLPFSPQVKWYLPKDEAIDLAVLPFGVSDKVDAIHIFLPQFLTSDVLDKQGVVPGDKVLTGGFFSGYAGLHEMQPILREGVLAMLPDGPMTTTLCGSGNVYLADVHVIPGNSGSPIFVIPALGLGASVGLGGVPNTFGLLGVVSGYMYENEDMTLTATTTWKGSVNANSGISVVVPAQQLKDLLESPELQHLREAQFNPQPKSQP
jgi:hypothetical protein